jgi:histidinol-phosphatase (PHP family)
MVRAALNQGLEYVCFTEHVDFNTGDDGYDYYDYEGYSTAIERARERYGEEIVILKGIEFTEPHLYPREFEKECRRDYDMIMAGLHWYDDLFYGDIRLRRKYSKEAILERYFRDLKSMLEVGEFDVLAHLDLPGRYFGDLGCGSELLQPLCELLVSHDIVPEVNTSPFRNGYAKSMPERETLELYLKCGGQRITIGSDSHSVDAVGADFNNTVNYLGETLKKLDCGIFVQRDFRKIEI